MSYMNCPRCGLSVRLRADQLAWGHCPQCLGRAGTVVSIGGESYYGAYYPRIRLDDGHDVILAHVQPPVVVQVGQRVNPGQLVAYVGSQGVDSQGHPTSTGCHLHFEVRPAGGGYGTA